MAQKIFLNNLGADVIAFIESCTGGGGAGLTEEIISNVAVGAANAKTKFPQYTTLTEFAKMILLKDIAPSVSVSASGSGVKEKGTKVNGTTITLSISNSGSVTVPMTEIRFYDGSLLLDTQPYVEGKNAYSYNYPTTIDTDKTVKAELVYGAGSTVEDSASFNFVYASYYGTTNKSTITDADANALVATFNKSVKTGKGLTWNNITLNDERFCYMYPASMGNLTSIKDGNGFQQLYSYDKTQVTINSPIDGTPVKYNCYLLIDAATGTGFSQIYS